MQDRYAADIGNYVKLAIIRKLALGHQLGVLWWLYPDESHNADGKHIGYLRDPSEWRAFDPPLFDALKQIVESGKRSVAALESRDLLANAVYFSEMLPSLGTILMRRSGRSQWFERAMDVVSDCDFVFLDPDNGLETSRFDPGRSKAGKSVSLVELESLRRPGRTLMVYHHHTRMAGGNLKELAHWGERLCGVGFEIDAVRASVGSARAFFLLDATAAIRETAKHVVHQWRGRMTWHPRLDMPDK